MKRKSRWETEPLADLGVETIGPDWYTHPPDCWGRRDREQARAMGKPMGQTLPPAPPDRMLPPGFALFPHKQQPPPTAGERALRQIKSTKANAALSKLGLRRRDASA